MESGYRVGGGVGRGEDEKERVGVGGGRIVGWRGGEEER